MKNLPFGFFIAMPDQQRPKACVKAGSAVVYYEAFEEGGSK